MSSILAYTQNGTFSPIDIETVSAVPNDVCEALKINGDAIAREVVAVRIVELARRGCACLGRGQEELVMMGRQYAVNVCRDEPNALRDLLGEIAKEGGRVISVNWQPARSVVGPGEPKEQNSGYVVVSEIETETE